MYRSIDGNGDVIVKENKKEEDGKHKLVTKRLPSRQSNTNNTLIDFDYKGNSTEFMHLLKRRDSGSPNIAQVKFELGLRSYMNNRQRGDSKSMLSKSSKNDKKQQWRYNPSSVVKILSSSDSIESIED